ncbi:hypothetical protein LCGC14_2691820 [marine sediment metagenome]|uniref:Uncharacterized protein n=1 Tax=marine sediment metagenome TaxID=412755 RepID=A0A0F8ZID6_9ZZZZ
MKRTIIAVCILVGVSLIAFAQTGKETRTSLERYQLIPATVHTLGRIGGTVEYRTAFLIDSQTGAVWQYEGRGVIGDEQKNDPVVKFAAHFARMPIGGLDGWSEELMWEMILEKQQKMRESREQRK